MVIALIVVGVLLFVLFIVILVCCVFFRRQRQKIKEYQSQFFPVTFEHAMVRYCCFIQLSVCSFVCFCVFLSYGNLENTRCTGS